MPKRAKTKFTPHKNSAPKVAPRKKLKTEKAGATVSPVNLVLAEESPFLSHILGFLIGKPKSIMYYQRLPVAHAIRSCAPVARAWRHTTMALVHKPPDGGFLGLFDLVSLKNHVAKLDLTRVRATFRLEMEARFSHVTVHGEWSSVFAIDVLDHQFPNLEEFVEKEYRLFLLVKCVEAMAQQAPESDGEAKKGGNGSREVWLEKCQPSQIVDIFWHAHMLHPRQYAQDCHALVGAIIDHDPGYISPKTVKGSDYQSKKKCLFSLEQQIVPRRFNYVRFRVDFGVESMAQDILNEMEMEDDAGCG